jgi:hypothetical protein
MKMKVHTEECCVWCYEPLPVKGWWQNYCSSKCAWKDGDAWVADQRDDRSRYFEV